MKEMPRNWKAGVFLPPLRPSSTVMGPERGPRPCLPGAQGGLSCGLRGQEERDLAVALSRVRTMAVELWVWGGLQWGRGGSSGRPADPGP